MKKSVKLTIKLESSLIHTSDESMGTTQGIRTMKYVVDGEALDIPVYSGNALRGLIRRLLMRDYITRVFEKPVECISEKLYYLLFVGGSLQSGEGGENLEQKRELRIKCPPLSLLGTAIGNSMIQGKMKVGICVPQCEELMGPGYPSVWDLREETFYVRKDDLKTAYDVPAKVEKRDNAVQMKYETQALAAGTILDTYLDLLIPNEIEVACMGRAIELLQEFGYIGGKAQAGHGKITLTASEAIDSKPYLDYIEENKEELAAWLTEVDKTL